MATRILGGHRLTIQALDLGPRGYAAVGARYRAAHRAVEQRALGRVRSGSSTAATAAGLLGVVAIGAAAIAFVFFAAGAPVWLGIAIGACTFLPIVSVWRNRPRDVVVERYSRADSP